MKKHRINDIMKNIIIVIFYSVCIVCAEQTGLLRRECRCVLLCCDSDSLWRSAIRVTTQTISCPLQAWEFRPTEMDRVLFMLAKSSNKLEIL